MTRKIVFSLVVATLLLSSPVALVAQDGPAPVEVSFATDSGAGDAGDGLSHVTAKHGADADPNGEAAEVAGGPTFDLAEWLRAFLSSVLPL